MWNIWWDHTWSVEEKTRKTSGEAVCQQKSKFQMHVPLGPVFPSLRIYSANKLGDAYKVMFTKWSLAVLFVTTKQKSECLLNGLFQ